MFIDSTTHIRVCTCTHSYVYVPTHSRARINIYTNAYTRGCRDNVAFVTLMSNDMCPIRFVKLFSSPYLLYCKPNFDVFIATNFIFFLELFPMSIIR